MKRDRKALLLGAAVWVIAVWGIQAADQIYELDPLLVTAERTVTEDLKTPSAVTVLTREQLMQTGATGLQEALKFTTGIIIHAQGPRNISQGTMSNKVVIRGVEKGTLVLIDGVPINQSGRYNLEDIPVETVERVEIVRGGGAVLYGSEAAGGVINIITRGTRENMVKTGWGNYGIQNHAVSAQLGKLGITYTYDHTGKIDHISARRPAIAISILISSAGSIIILTGGIILTVIFILPISMGRTVIITGINLPPMTRFIKMNFMGRKKILPNCIMRKGI